MIFDYCEYVVPDDDDFGLLLRPEIPVELIGPKGTVVRRGLVDTGSDNTIFPKSVADFLEAVFKFIFRGQNPPLGRL